MCIVCGSNGGADIIANVLLFLPLGVGLRLGGLGVSTALLLGAATSLVIELAQFFVIVGRFGTLSDFLTNSLGALVGAVVASHAERLLAPDRVLARRLAVAAAGVWAATVAGAAWATTRRLDTTPFPSVVGELPSAPAFGWFAGTVDTVVVNGHRIPHRSSGPVIVRTPVGARFEATVSAVGDGGSARFHPLLFVHRPGDTTPSFILGVRGRDAILGTALRGRAASLRPLWLTVRDAIPAATDTGERYTIRGEADGDALRLSIHTRSATRRAVLRLGPSIAWATITGIPSLDSSLAPVISAVWLAALAVPAIYWTARATAPDRGGEQALRGARRLVSAVVTRGDANARSLDD